jgi:hypothetical protein
MIAPKIKAAAALLLLSLTVRCAVGGNAIEFSAALQKFIGEGIVYQRLVFKDENRTVFYQPPPGWTCSLDGNRLRLATPNEKFADAEISAVATEKPLTINQSAAAAVAQQLTATLPVGNQRAIIVKQEQNPFFLNNNPTVEVIVSYELLGYTFQRAVVCVMTPANQIFFKMTARRTEFDALYRSFRASITTWDWQPDSRSPEPPA